MTRICIVGAGAIGGFLAHALHRAGADVSLVARGANLTAMRAQGLTLIADGKRETIQFAASEDAATFGVQDMVLIALKAHGVPALAAAITPLLGPETAVVSAVNGIPWWYFHGLNDPRFADRPWLHSVDPGGVQWRAFGPERAIGCVVYQACEMTEPGCVRHIGGDRVSLGEPDGRSSARVKRLADLLRAGGIRAPVKARIRDELWLKLLGNCSFNPVSALTGGSLDRIGNDPGCRAVLARAMEECRMVGRELGARFAIGIEQRIDGGAAIIGHKSSTLQDLEQGRPVELDAILCSVLELARRLGIATPCLDMLAALTRLQAAERGLYEPNPDVSAAISSAT